MLAGVRMEVTVEWGGFRAGQTDMASVPTGWYLPGCPL